MSTSPGVPRTKSLGRAIELLRAIASRPGGSSASELARAIGLPRSTATRTLRTLADAGLVEEAARGGWTLGYELVRLARAADPHEHLVQAARPALDRLRTATDESTLLAVPRDRPGIEILLQFDPDRHIGVANWVGTDVPLHASAAGKLALAELSQDELDAWIQSTPLRPFTDTTITSASHLRAQLTRIRLQGWAELADELEQGLASIAVPIRHHIGTLAAMIGISGPTFRLSKTRRQALLPTVQAAATEIEQALAR
jgi:DNA-binding IclR family transcriptional regulator